MNKKTHWTEAIKQLAEATLAAVASAGAALAAWSAGTTLAEERAVKAAWDAERAAMAARAASCWPEEGIWRKAAARRGSPDHDDHAALTGEGRI